MKALTLTLTLTFLALAAHSHAGDEARYSTHIKPVFEKRCAPCHGADSPEYKDFKKEKERYQAILKGPRMDTYPHLIYFVGWPDTGALMRRLDDGANTKDGKPGNMYQYLGATEKERRENLGLFKRWVGNWTLKRWREASKQDIDAMQLEY